VLYEPHFQVPCSSNNVRGGPILVAPFYVPVVPPTIDVLHIRIGPFSERRNSVLRHSGPLLSTSSGVALELTLSGGFIVDELVGLEYRWTVRVVKHEYMCDCRILMLWV